MVRAHAWNHCGGVAGVWCGPETRHFLSSLTAEQGPSCRPYQQNLDVPEHRKIKIG